MEVLLKLIFLWGFSIFFYLSINTGKVQHYVHPRIIPYMRFAIFSFMIISIFLSREIFKVRRKNNKILHYLLFVIPLITAFGLPPETMVSESMALNSIKNRDNLDIDLEDKTSTDRQINLEDKFIVEGTIDVDESNILNSIDTENQDLINYINGYEESRYEMRGNTIIINDNSFLPWLDELYTDIGEYKDKKVEITGFVLKDSRFRQDEFIIARLMMVCCAADMQPVGFLSRYNQSSELELDSWIKINGIVEYESIEGEEIPIINVENIEKIDKPEFQFLYPY